MRIAKQRMTCKCGHVFEAELVVDATLDVAIASMMAIRCPECGSGEVGIGGAYNDAPPLTAPIEQRAAWWRKRGETGTSSLTIYCAFLGGVLPLGFYCYPLDPDDFRRCKLLLDLIPEWREDLGMVCARFPWFKPFTDRWAEFEALYSEESPHGRCPKLFAAMQVARKEAEALKERPGPA